MGTRKLSEYIIDLVLLITGLGLFLSSQSIAAGSAMGQGGDFMPKLCTGLWVLISIGLLVTEKMAADDHVKGITADVKGFMSTLALLFVYIFLLDILGFVLASALYMFVQMCIFVPKELRSKRNYILFVVLSVIIPVAVNEVFVEVFSLILPTGIL